MNVMKLKTKENIKLGFYESITSLPIALIVTIFLIILALVAKIPARLAVKNGLVAGIATLGISVMMNQLGSLILQISNYTIDILGVAKPVSDLGRGFSQYITESGEFAAIAVVIGILVNLIMLFTKSTRIVNLNIASYWLCGLCGALSYTITEDVYISIFAIITSSVLTLVFTDMGADSIYNQTQVRGLAFYDPQTAAFAPVAAVMNYAVEKLPETYKKDFELKFTKKKRRDDSCEIAVLIMIVTIAVVIVVGGDITSALELGFYAATITFVSKILFDKFINAFKPIGSAISEFSVEKLNLHGGIRIAFAPITAMSIPLVVLLSVVMTPITILLSVYLPANNFLPTVDIITLPYIILAVVLICSGKVIRSFVASVVSVCVALYSATFMSGVFTQAVMMTNPVEYADIGISSNLFGAGNPIIVLLTTVSTYGVAGMGIMLILIASICVWNMNKLNGHVKIYAKKIRHLLASNLSDEERAQEEQAKKLKEAITPKRQKLRDAVAGIERTEETDNAEDIQETADDDDSDDDDETMKVIPEKSKS